MTITQIQALINGKTLNERQLINLLADYIQDNPPTQPVSSALSFIASVTQSGVGSLVVTNINNEVNISAFTKLGIGLYQAVTDQPVTKKSFISGSAFHENGSRSFRGHYNLSGILKMLIGVSVYDVGGFWAILINSKDESGQDTDLGSLLPFVDSNTYDIPEIKFV